MSSIWTTPFVDSMTREPDAAECVIVDDAASRSREASLLILAPSTSMLSTLTGPFVEKIESEVAPECEIAAALLESTKAFPAEEVIAPVVAIDETAVRAPPLKMTSSIEIVPEVDSIESEVDPECIIDAVFAENESGAFAEDVIEPLTLIELMPEIASPLNRTSSTSTTPLVDSIVSELDPECVIVAATPSKSSELTFETLVPANSIFSTATNPLVEAIARDPEAALRSYRPPGLCL